MPIAFIDLKAQFAVLEPEIRRRMDAVLAHGKCIMGPEVAELETALAAFVGARHAVTCASGTDALLMPLLADTVVTAKEDEKAGSQGPVVNTVQHMRPSALHPLLASDGRKSARR